MTKLEDDMKEKLSTADLGPVAASVKECKYNYEWEVELIQNHVNAVEEKIAEHNRRMIIIESF